MNFIGPDSQDIKKFEYYKETDGQTDRQTDRQTDATENITTPHSQVRGNKINSINQSIIYFWNINSQDSDSSQYTSFTGFQGRKACTDRNPLNTYNNAWE